MSHDRSKIFKISKKCQKPYKTNGFFIFYGCLGGILEALGGVLEALGGVLEPLGGILEASWWRLGGSWSHLGRSLGHLEGVLEAMLSQDEPR